MPLCNRRTQSTGLCLLIAGLSVLLGACNSLFYHPDRLHRLDPSALGIDFEEVHVPLESTDPKATVHAWFLKPQAQRFKAPKTKEPPSAWPTVVHFHGNAENMTSHILFVSWLVELGYEVVTFDYRGYGKSPGSTTRSSTVEDGAAVLRFLVDTHQHKNLVVIGQSLGGAVAVASLSRLPKASPARQAIKGVVLESTFASYRQMARSKLAELGPLALLQKPLSYLVSDEDSAIDSIHDLGDVPLLQIHGDKDPVVPWAQGRLLFDAAQDSALNETRRQWITVPGGGHTPAFGWSASPYHGQLLAFIEALGDR